MARKIRRAFFKHFGSKGRVSAKLPPPKHKLIIEPFAGSAAYSVRHAALENDVLLIDSDERVCLMWEFVIGASPADIMALPVDPILERADIRELGLSVGQMLFIQRWLSPSGSSSNFRMPPSCITQSLKGQNSFWGKHTRASVASQIDTINHWKIQQGSYLSAPDVVAHWEIDPPYQGNKHGFIEYKCDPLDFDILANWCKSRQGDVVVHEQGGAEWLPFDPFLEMSTSASMKSGKLSKCKEVIWRK